jgi:hypothetical protein
VGGRHGTALALVAAEARNRVDIIHDDMLKQMAAAAQQGGAPS